MAADLEFSGIPGGVFVGRTAHMAILDLESSFVGVDIQGESQLHKLVMLMSINLMVKVDATTVFPQPNVLHQGGVLIGA